MKRIIFILSLIVGSLLTSMPVNAINLNNDSLVITNNTYEPYLDSVVYAGLQSLGIKKANILILPFDRIRIYSGSTKDKIDAAIYYNGYNYLLYVRTLPKKGYLKVIAHELIHLKQYYNGDLSVNNEYVVWKGKRTSVDIINIQSNYCSRPWEKEAFENQLDLAEKINNKLKNKMIMKDAMIIEHIDGSFGLYTKNCEEIESGFETYNDADDWAFDNGVNIVSSFGDDWTGPKYAMNRKKLRYTVVVEFDDDIKGAGVYEDEVQKNLLNAIISQVDSTDVGIVGDDAETFTKKITVIDSEGKKIEKTF